jgi:hypothetical protein
MSLQFSDSTPQVIVMQLRSRTKIGHEFVTLLSHLKVHLYFIMILLRRQLHRTRFRRALPACALLQNIL